MILRPLLWFLSGTRAVAGMQKNEPVLGVWSTMQPISWISEETKETEVAVLF